MMSFAAGLLALLAFVHFADCQGKYGTYAAEAAQTE